MKRSRWSAFLVVIFLIQCFSPAAALSGPDILLPEIRTAAGSDGSSFKNFIMRIFLTQETQYQTRTKVLYEGRLDNPAVTFQVLPSLNELLSDCAIKPVHTYSTSQVDRSS